MQDGRKSSAGSGPLRHIQSGLITEWKIPDEQDLQLHFAKIRRIFGPGINCREEEHPRAWQLQTAERLWALHIKEGTEENVRTGVKAVGGERPQQGEHGGDRDVRIRSF